MIRRTLSATGLPWFGSSGARILALLIVLAAALTVRGATRLDGQVVNSASGAPVDNATATLDLEPADGTAEYTFETDPFGFFKFPEVTPGTYKFSVEKAGFVRHEESVVFASGDKKTAVVRLSPLAVSVTFDIFFQVWCLATHARMAGATVTAQYWKPDGDLSGLPDKTFIRNVDPAGAVVLAGMEDGFYRFSVNKTGWEPLTYSPPPGSGFITDGDRVRLDNSHFASVFVKPIKTTLSVTVQGFDPVKNQANQPLQGMVLNLTGVEPRAPPADDAVLVPTRSALSAKDGIFVFGGLAPVTYKLTVGRLGYRTKEVYISPNAMATFNPQVIMMDLEPTKVRAVLSSVYRTPNAVRNATIRLQGLRNSNTEGINRELISQTDAPSGTARALFENLLPGRYWIHVVHQATLTGLPGFSGPIQGPTSFQIAFFPKETYGEVIGGVTEEVKLELDPVPAVIRGRLFATDQLANRETEVFNPEPFRIFHKMAQNGIDFAEHKVINLLTNPINRTTVDTDESGAYTALVIPGIYGVQIPGIAGYSGHNIEFGDISVGGRPMVGPWPYPDIWPYGQWEFGHHGAGLRFDSAHEYQLDLFLHAHYINVSGQVTSQGDPFGSLILRMNLDGTGVEGMGYNHLRDTDARVSATGPVSATAVIDANDRYLLPNLTPGSYTVTIDHPDYDVAPVQVTITPWQAPGFIPAVAPFTPTYFFPGITHADFEFNLNPVWKTPGILRVNRYTFNTANQEYTFNGFSAADYFRATGLPNKLFSLATSGGIPSGAYTIWERHGNGWYSAAGAGSMTFDGAFEGGLSDNTNPNNPPIADTSYTLDLHALNEADHSVEIPGVTVTFSRGAPRVAGGTVAHDGSPNPIGATHSGGQWAYGFQNRVELINSDTRLIKTTVFMRRAMVVSGVVTADGAPVGSAAVVVRNRWGVALGQAVTTTNGNYAVINLTPQPVYVDVNKRGFIPQRRRFDPPSLANPDIVANFALAMVPAPTIDTFTMNRFGLFLPGVSRSGDQSGFDIDNAREELTLTWKSAARGENYTVTLDGFVQPDGTQGPPEVSEVIDRVEELWLVDRRSYTNALVNQLDQTHFDPLDPPNPLNYPAIVKWLRDLTTARKNNQPFYAIHQLKRRGQGGQMGNQFEGQLNLWELPSGVFNPRLIAITQNGGVAVKHYELPEGKKSLQGMRLPQWAAFLLDLIGVGANLGELEFDLLKGLPAGGFLKVGSVTPALEGRIGLIPTNAVPESDAYLTYKYVIGVDLPVGEGTAETGPLAFGPKFFGLRIQGAAAEFEVNGEDKEAGLAIVLKSAEPEDDLKKLDNNYRPPLAAREMVQVTANDFEYQGKVGVSQTLDADWLGQNIISAMALNLEVQGLYDFGIRFNATPVLGALPFVGQPLLALDKIGAATIFLRIEASVGAKVAAKYETVFAQPGPGGTRPAGGDPLPERPNFLGVEKIEVDSEVKVIARVAGGLDISLGGGTVEGTALLQLGAPVGHVDTDGMFFTIETAENKSPLIKKIEGAFSVVVRLSINLWTAKFGKQWQWDIARFIVDRGSEPSFELVPMHITLTRIMASSAPQQTFVGDSRLLVDQFYQAGSFAASGDALAFTGINPANGNMTVMVSVQHSNQWSVPVQIAEAAGVISVATIALPGGGWMAVWSEISAQDVMNPYPASTLRYSIGNQDGSVWSAPANVAASTEATFDLKLVSAGAEIILTYLSTAEGPVGDHQSLYAATWNGAAWSAPAEVFADQSINDYDAAGNTVSNALAVISTAAGELLYSAYSNPWSAPASFGTNAGGPLSLEFDGTNTAILLWQDTAGSLAYSRYDLPSDQWTHSGMVVSNALAREVQILSLSNTYLLAWIEGGSFSSLWYAFIDPQGAILLDRRELTLDSTGSFRNLQVRPLPGLRASLVAQYTEGTNSSLRHFTVGLPSADDCDGDGILDAAEIAGGSATDLNANGVPDDCEIAGRLLVDRNRNGVPDLFEPAPPGDCNRNGMSDRDEFYLGIALDVNNNNIPDDCELVTRTLPIQSAKATEFFRALRLIIKAYRPNELDLEYQGRLEKADELLGPWIDVP